MGLIIGIDPGVTTGVARYDREARRLQSVGSTSIVQAMLDVLDEFNAGRLDAVRFEDARMRGNAGNKAASLGAGSVRRDCSVWEEWLTQHCIPFRKISPRQKGAKLDAERFAKLTGWTQRTNEHGRDAAMLVWGV